ATSPGRAPQLCRGCRLSLLGHRLSLAGNRHLNYALHMVAVCQARSDARGGAYYRKKVAEGKSRKEALSA
ncbi:MAG TPA: hypothetical protein VNB92_09055, partial [Rubrobacter sp.]|nr:hypothetical protein [Rubrobacter sp.]